MTEGLVDRIVGYGILLADDILTRCSDVAGLRLLDLDGMLVVRINQPRPGFFLSFADGWISTKSYRVGPEFPKKTKKFKAAFGEFARQLRTICEGASCITTAAYVIDISVTGARIVKVPRPKQTKHDIITELFGSDEELVEDDTEKLAKRARIPPSASEPVSKSRSSARSSKKPPGQLRKLLREQIRKSRQSQSARPHRPFSL